MGRFRPLLLVAILAGACGESRTPATQGEPPAEPPAPGREAAATEPEQGRDLSGVRACQMFSGEQLAALLGVELSEPPKPIEATRETPEAGCSYIFPRQGTVRGRVDIELHDAVDYEMVRRGDVALKVMADSPELARKVAEWAAQRL